MLVRSYSSTENLCWELRKEDSLYCSAWEHIKRIYTLKGPNCWMQHYNDNKLHNLSNILSEQAVMGCPCKKTALQYTTSLYINLKALRKMNLSKKATIHIESKKKIEFLLQNPELEVQYPESWFKNNEKKKPQILIPKLTLIDESSDTLKRLVFGGIDKGDLTLETAKCFLYEYMKKMNHTLDEDWTSFKVNIGSKGTKIGPLNLVEISEGEEHTPSEVEYAGGHKWSEKSAVMFILGVYRLSKGWTEEYRAALAERISSQIVAEGTIGMSLAGLSDTYSAWSRDNDYLKMVAAIDMYLYRFKTCEHATIRICTLGSRYRDCAGLTTFGYAMKSFGLESYELMDWIMVKSAGLDIIRITKADQETCISNSYFPYQSDFKLVERSAYSSVVNSTFFHLIHIAGALLGNKRSINARYTFDGYLSDVQLNAALIAHVFHQGTELTPQFSQEGTDYSITLKRNQKEQDPESDEEEDQEKWFKLTDKKPEMWYALLCSEGFILPKSVIKRLKKMQDRIKDPREGTIGKHVKEMLFD